MQLVQITPEKKVKLTKKQSEILRNIDNLGPMFVSYRDEDMRMFEALVKKGVAKVVGQDGYGVKYQIVKAQT